MVSIFGSHSGFKLFIPFIELGESQNVLFLFPPVWQYVVELPPSKPEVLGGKQVVAPRTNLLGSSNIPWWLKPVMFKNFAILPTTLTSHDSPHCYVSSILYTTALFEEGSIDNRAKGSTHQSHLFKVPSRYKAITSDINAGINQKTRLPSP